MVLALLLLDFRALAPALFAAAPTAVALLWVWGGMGLAGLHLNPANLIAFPLLVGIGVDAGVHVLHRYRQDPARDVAGVLRHTGFAVLLATGTTLMGLGSLALARHRGVASLGTVLALGLSACLVTALLGMPALLAWRRRR